MLKLYLQALGVNYIPVPVEDHIPLSVEKFAELIVAECAMICDKVYEQNHNIQIRAGATFCREDIKEHFGVEE